MMGESGGKVMEEQHEHEQINTKRIDPQLSWEMNFWCEEFNLRAEELKEIIKNVGPEINNIRMFLAKRLLVSWPMTY
jgi:hypothetical protein